MTLRPYRSHLDIQGARFYPFPGPPRESDGRTRYVPSVTAVAEVFPKGWLAPWAAKAEKQGILGALEAYLHERPDASRGEMLARVLALKADPLCYKRVKETAADIGTSAHAWIEWKLTKMMGGKLGPEPALLPGAERATMAAEVWMAQVNLVPLEIEKRVYDPEVGYAGRMDLKAEVDWTLPTKAKERRVVVVDWKTAKGIYEDMFIQNIAYRRADSLNPGPHRSSGGVIVRLAKTADDPVPFETEQVDYDPELWTTFVTARAFWERVRMLDGKWTGGWATDDEIAALQAPNRRRKKTETPAPKDDKKWMQASFEKAGL